MGEGAGVVADRSIRGVPNVDGKDFLGPAFAEWTSLADISSHLMVTMRVFVPHCNVSFYVCI
jgi:hypothetical protein